MILGSNTVATLGGQGLPTQPLVPTCSSTHLPALSWIRLNLKSLAYQYFDVILVCWGGSPWGWW